MPAGLQVVPSLLAADFTRLGEEIRTMGQAGALWLQLDVMDGHFVPNITFGPAWLRAVRSATDLYLDAHLMMTHPLDFLAPFLDGGADLVTVHAEVDQPLGVIADRVHEGGADWGLAFRPATDPIPFLKRHALEADLILVMTVEPGFGGQSFMEEMLPKIREVRAFREKTGGTFRIQVDGGIGPETLEKAVRAGADALVAGSAVFGRNDPVEAFRDLTRRAASAREGEGRDGDV
jgi:ribulose-phosphate 3-epimerase